MDKQSLLGGERAPPAKVPNFLKICHVIGYVILVIVNIGSAKGWFGKTNTEVSKEWPIPITPSGWAFSIWGIIFLLQGLGAIYQLCPKNYGQTNGEKEQAVLAGAWIQGTWLCQCFWQVAFSKEKFSICIGLIAGALIFGIYTTMQLMAAKEATGMGFLSELCFSIPSSINSAWLTAATSVQIGIALKSFGVTAGHLEASCVVLVAMAGLCATWFVVAFKNYAWGLTTVWALVAIASNGPPTAVFVSCAIAGVVLLLALLHTITRSVVMAAIKASNDKAATEATETVPLAAAQTQFVVA